MSLVAKNQANAKNQATATDESETLVEESSRNSNQLSLIVRGKKIPCPGARVLVETVPSLRTDVAEIGLPDDGYVEAVGHVVRYLEEGDMDDGVGPHNATEILYIARLFSLDGARDACEDSLVRALSAETCVQLRQLATHRNLPRLREKCDRFLSEEFPSVLAGQPVLLQLPRLQVQLDVSSQLLEFDADLLEKVVPKTLETLVSLHPTRNHLEEAVVQLVLLPDLSVCQWSARTSAQIVESSSFSPEKWSTDLLSRLKAGGWAARPVVSVQIRGKGSGKPRPGKGTSMKTGCQPRGMQLIAMTRLSDAACVCLVEEQATLLVVALSLCTVMHDSHLPASPTTGLPVFAHTSSGFRSPMHTARGGFGVVATEAEILTVGGFNRAGCLDSCERYSSITNSWKQSGRMQKKRGRFCAVSTGHKVYAVGGSDGRKELSCMEVLDLRTLQWERVSANMPTPRSSFGAVQMEGKIFAVGGEHYSVPLKTAEVFDPRTESWESLPPLHVSRGDVAVAACAGKVYAIGGRTSCNQCHASVECFDPRQNTWTPVPSMRYPRRAASAITVGNKIMVIGGYNGTQPLRSVEMFDPETETWAELPAMFTARSHTASILYNGMVYVFGGYSGDSFLNRVECFDLNSEQWSSFV